MITIDFNLHSSLIGSDGDGDGLLTEIKGDISSFGEDWNEVRIGIMDSYLLNHDLTINRGYNPIDVLDWTSSETEVYASFFGNNGYLNEELWMDRDEPPYSENILILNRLKIVRDFRGLNIGAAAIARTITTFAGGTYMTILNSSPLQITHRNSVNSIKKLNKKEPWMDYRLTSYKKRTAQKRLNRYYQMLGFTPCKNLKNFFYTISSEYLEAIPPHDLLDIDRDKLDKRHERFIKKFPEGMPRTP